MRLISVGKHLQVGLSVSDSNNFAKLVLELTIGSQLQAEDTAKIFKTTTEVISQPRLSLPSSLSIQVALVVGDVLTE